MLLFGMFLIPNAHTNITEIDIDFQVGKCNVDTAYSDNARQLANLEKTIQYVNSHPNVRIERLTISGYASPEGPAVKNKQLGETRANALEQYIRSRIDIADSLVVRLPATIPWDMLKAEIRTSQEPGYNEIDRVLHSDSTVIEYLPGRWADRRAFEIQRQKAYKTLNRNVFPSMRSAKAQITTTESVPDGEIALPTADYDLSGISVPAVDIPDAKPGDSGEWTRGLYLKTNAVGWAMLISNIAVEVDINKHWSVTLPVYYSALNYFTRTRKLRTLAFHPEVRWWFAPKWFVGAHFGVAQYNYALSSSEWRYQDHNGNTPALGGGLSFGWRTPLGKSKHWMMELTAGAGCYRLKYDTFHNEANGAMVSTTSRTFFGVDNAAVTFIYRFDLKRKRR